MPRLKFFSPFLANAVIGAANRQKITSSDAKDRVWIDGLFMVTLSLRCANN